MNRTDKIRFVAQAFMKENPEEYEGETLEEVMSQLCQTSDSFIEHAFDNYGGNEQNVVSLQEAKLSRLPKIETNLDELSEVVRGFVNECIALGHRSICASYTVGNCTAKIDLEIKQNA